MPFKKSAPENIKSFLRNYFAGIVAIFVLIAHIWSLLSVLFP